MTIAPRTAEPGPGSSRRASGVAASFPPTSSPCPGPRAALIVAHPGHELRVHGWIEAVRPRVHVLTDGSGSSGRSRVESTRRILGRTGAEPAAIFGRLSDGALYEAILDGDHGLFVRLADELAESLDSARVEVVVGDAAEGYNPGHDACRLVIDAAVALVNRRRPRPLASFEFSLCRRPDFGPEAPGPRPLRLELDDDAFARKLAAARGYPELAAEVEAAFRNIGTAAFRVECLRPVSPAPAASDAAAEDAPAYERFGERRVDAGKYRRVLRYRAHMLPLARVLRRYVAGG